MFEVVWVNLIISSQKWKLGVRSHGFAFEMIDKLLRD